MTEKREYKTIDPISVGLSSRTKLIGLSTKHIGIVKDRKSRIIMKDGKQILEQADKIKLAKPDVKVSLFISSAICSKTRKFLLENSINTLSIDEINS